MLGITFSAEAEPSAAERISDCFQYFESRMGVIRLARYCKVLDSIKLILSTAPDEKERLKAAELLGKRYGLYTDKVDQVIDMELNITVDYGDGE